MGRCPLAAYGLAWSHGDGNGGMALTTNRHYASSHVEAGIATILYFTQTAPVHHSWFIFFSSWWDGRQDNRIEPSYDLFSGPI